MLSVSSLYILRQIIAYSLPIMAIALVALLLERMLRLLRVLGDFEQTFGYLPLLLINLAPHYLGLAMPVAFFLGVLLTFNRMNRDRELVVMLNSGIGLHQLLVPVMGLSFILALIAALIFSHLQPYGRHGYRAFVHAVVQTSLTAAARDGAFIQIDNMTFVAEGVPRDSSRLRKVFVYEQKADDRIFVTTAVDGRLFEPADEPGTILRLRDGQRLSVGPDGGRSTVLRFEEFSWPIVPGADRLFRNRGKDERELTLSELWRARDNPPRGITRAELTAEIHGRLVRILTVLLLPVLAMPLALGGGREGRSTGIIVGLLALIVYHEALQVGESLVAQDRVTPWLGMWTVFFLFAAGSGYLFYRASFSVNGDPFAKLAGLVGAVIDQLGRLKGRAER